MRDGSYLGRAAGARPGAEGFAAGRVDRDAARPAKGAFPRRAASSAAVILGLLVFGGTASAAGGGLDSTFGSGGRVTTDFDNRDDRLSALVVQSDSKIVAAGSSCDLVTGPRTRYCEETGIALARYEADGSLDEGFGAGGKVITSLGTGEEYASDLAVQPDGKLVVAGGSESDSVLARYEADGSLDESFGAGGRVTTGLFGGSREDHATYLAIQPDGRIVAAGGYYSGAGSHFDFALARYEADGSLDEGFGTGGKAITDFGGEQDMAEDVAVQPDGKLVAVGHAENGGTGYDFALARYEADGSLDSSFDGDGKTTIDFDGYGDLAHALAVQPDGRLVAAGVASTSGGEVFALARYKADGSLDEGFGTGGKVTTEIDDRSNAVHAIALQLDGKLVAAGGSALARYKADGSLDEGFGAGGKATTDFSGSGGALALQPDGKLVVAGDSNVNDGYRADFALARYYGSTGAAPVAKGDSYKIGAGKTLTVRARQGVLANDEGENLSSAVVKKPKNGRLTLNKEGSFTYKPRRGFEGRDTFTYRATDGAAKSKTATVTIRVKSESRETKKRR